MDFFGVLQNVVFVIVLVVFLILFLVTSLIALLIRRGWLPNPFPADSGSMRRRRQNHPAHQGARPSPHEDYRRRSHQSLWSRVRRPIRFKIW